MAMLLPYVRLGVAATALVGVIMCMQRPAVSAQPPAPSASGAKTGLWVNDSRAYRGYSLVAPMNSTRTHLIYI